MKTELHHVMLVGTGSDVGKSVLAAALCRIFKQDGYSPAPFKAQNMALNSFATSDGKEIGRAQAVQAEAAGIPPQADMNPILLKPNSEHTTQVVVLGKPIGNRNAYDYFRHEGRGELRKVATDAFDRLAARFNPVVMEGAGSVSELNLRDTDIVNMSMARHADARVLLVADIDRGGVFASSYGSIMLQTPEDKARIKGIVVNKFRGDLRLFDEGRALLERICGVPVLGVVPMFSNIAIEEEDSVELEQKRRKLEDGKINVAVVLLRHISNFTDFQALENVSRANLFYTNNPDDLRHSDIIILPGTKSTISDLYELRRNGVAQAILHAHKEGKATILGICGGYQMLGESIADPDGVEGNTEQFPGLGLLPITTTMRREKTTRQVSFVFHDGTRWTTSPCQGYEIHQGQTDNGGNPLTRLSDGTPDGCRNGNCLGTYIHGILDNPPFIDSLLARHSVAHTTKPTISRAEFKEQQYEKLAAHVCQHIDMPQLYRILSD